MIMRKLVLVGLMAAALILPQQVRAGGIPVFDGVGLAQQITGYVQNLMDYAEQLNQLNTMSNQYMTQVQQYQRELEEYQHFLTQLERLGPVLKDADWEKVLGQTVTYYGDSPWASIPNVNVTTSQDRVADWPSLLTLACHLSPRLLMVAIPPSFVP